MENVIDIVDLIETPRWNQLTNTVELFVKNKEVDSNLDLNQFKSAFSQHWFLQNLPTFKHEYRQEIEKNRREGNFKLLNFNIEVSFYDCDFHGVVFGSNEIEGNFIFEKCNFIGGISVPNSTFLGKIKVRDSFLHDINLANTTFSDLIDFWLCEFYEKVIFLKTDFIGTAVFSASTFRENVLFTYSLIDKAIILRGTKFLKGLDFSLSIGKGEKYCFDLIVKDYDAVVVDTLDGLYEKTYDDYVTNKGIIPLKNKRETFRILKQTLVSQGNISESIYYKVIEKETLRRELLASESKRLKDNDYYYLFNLLYKWFCRKRAFMSNWFKKVSPYVGNYLDMINLWMNKVSNYYGKSYGRSLVFILLVGGLFFYASAIASNTYKFAFSIDKTTLGKGVGHFVQFLLPTHDFGYIGDLENVSVWYFIWDFIGRLFVGYGIYQFIQAFRKYR